MKIVEACGSAAANTQRIAVNGINDPVVIGAPEYFFVTPLGVQAPNRDAAVNIDTFNNWVLSNGGVYLGRHEVESAGTDKTVFESAFHNLRAKTANATKVLRLSAPLCPCTSAELEKIDGRNWLVWELSSTGVLRGTVNTDWSIQGFSCYIEKNLNTIGTTDSPVENTVIEITYSNPRKDQTNPFAVPVNWTMDEIDQAFGLAATISNGASNGTNTTFDLTITKDCTSEALNGAVVANFKVQDANGADIATFTVNETAGVYSFDVTTAESTVYVETDGIVQIANVLYNMDLLTVATA